VTCPGVSTYDGHPTLCGKPIDDPGLWLAGELDYCSPRCAAAADNAIHSGTRVQPARVEWQHEAEMRAAARRIEERLHDRETHWQTEGSGI